MLIEMIVSSSDSISRMSKLCVSLRSHALLLLHDIVKDVGPWFPCRDDIGVNRC